MALRGTLKDFGIADILQLIGHQGKTGTLTVRNRDQEVRVHFHKGSVAGADSSTRKRRELFGALLLRAEVLTQEQLDNALEVQKSTLKRVGDVLVEQGLVDKETLKTFVRIQTQETLYRLFLWESGTYDFQQADVEVDPDLGVFRSENVLMEGFRQVDEWPAIRKKISAYSITFRKLEDLDALSAEDAAASDDSEEDEWGLDDAFAEFEGGSSGGSGRLKNIGQNERIVYQLIEPNRDVQKVIDLSRLGEFETCKALATLIESEIIEPCEDAPKKASAEATVGGIHARGSRIAPVLTRVMLSLLLLVAGVLTARYAGVSLRPWLASLSNPSGYQDVSVKATLSEGRMARLRAALDVFRAEHGEYPETLKVLVDAGLLEERDLHFPWESTYFYAREGKAYELLRPLY